MAILERLATADSTEGVDADVEERMAWLLGDFLACVQVGSAEGDQAPRPVEGICDLAGWLARQAGRTDLDDVDWTSLHHPGSVIWAAIVALARHGHGDATLIRQAAVCGYATTATMADALGPRHRRRWHVTATAGSIGAAAAASTLLGLSVDDRYRAMCLAAANAGGLALAARERGGAAAFNRAAAAVLGVAAAQAAASGAAAISDPITGPCGLMDAMDAEMDAAEPQIRAGIRDACIRRYPVTGFLHAAVEAAAAARQTSTGELDRIRVELADTVLPLVSDDAHGPWWNARLSVLRAWAHGNPSRVDEPGVLDACHDRVELVPGDVGPGAAFIRVQTDSGELTEFTRASPTQVTEELPIFARAKWTEVWNLEPDRVMAEAYTLLEI